MEFEYIKVGSGTAAGVTVPISASVSYTLPLATGGTTARVVRVLPEAACFINFGTAASVTASVTNSHFVTPNEAQYFDVKGYSYFAVIVKTTPTVISVSPVEI